jgi:hypothetical protein
MQPVIRLLTVLVAAGLCAPALAEEDNAFLDNPALYVQSLYVQDWPGDGARYTARLEELKEQCFKREEETGEMCLDFDFFVQAQDHDLTNLTFKNEEQTGDTAKVRATFMNMGERTTILFDLVKDEKGWVIDEMTTECDTLSGLYRGEEPSC